MKVIIITQDEPFFLAEHLDDLLSRMPDFCQVNLSIITEPSPFGGRRSFIQRAAETLKIFGAGFFIRYSIKFILSRMNRSKSVPAIMTRHGVPVWNFCGNINSGESLRQIRKLEPDVIISIAANQIFRKKLLEIPAYGIINLHTSSLPEYRGLMPVFWALRYGEKRIGVSVFRVDEGIDSGPILVQKQYEVEERNLEKTIRATKRIGMDCIIEALEKLHGGEYELQENDDSKKSYYSFPSRQDVKAFLKGGNRLY